MGNGVNVVRCSAKTEWCQHPECQERAKPPEKAELTAALKRFDIARNEDGSISIDCDCGYEFWAENLLDIVTMALEHRHVCPRA